MRHASFHVEQWYVSTLPEQWFCCQDKLLCKHKRKHHTDIQLLVGINTQHIFILFNQSMNRVRKIELLRSTPEISSTDFPFPWRCIFSLVLPLPDALACKNRSLKLRQNIRLINSAFYLHLHIHSPLRWTPTCLYFSSKVSTHHSCALWHVCFHLVMNWSLSYLVITSVS